MSKKNGNKKQKGFTLVEVIVVAVIVLILSAVAIPMYNGFVRQARQDTVNNLAETAAAAANAYWRKTALAPDLADLKLHYETNKYDVTVGDLTAGTITVKERDPCRSGGCLDTVRSYK